MNKKLIAVAVAAGLALPGLAAAEVKIIGQAQLELVNTSSSDGSGRAEGLTLDDAAAAGNVGGSNASALGITGSHDLGNGLTGLYKANFNFQGDDGVGGLNRSRDVFVGMKGGFGAVLFGRMNSPYKSSTVKWDPLLATFMQSRVSNGASALNTGYLNDVIAYANTFGTIKFVGAISLDESDNNENAGAGDGDLDGDHAITFSVNVPIGDALEIAVGYLNLDSLNDGTAIKVGLNWKGDGMGGSVQIEALDKDLGDANHIYANYHIAVSESGAVVVGLGTRTDESSGGSNDGTYAALAYKSALSKKVSWHAGVVLHDEGVVGQNEDVTQIGGGVRVKF